MRSISAPRSRDNARRRVTKVVRGAPAAAATHRTGARYACIVGGVERGAARRDGLCDVR